ncbi:TPA: hypothetical protein DCF80_01310 [Candidatus Saccharibacteria bacterium]|nr:hypothetical protein [Candidatus Saccharibacteria bacterium]HRK41389.1 hypothetical protein [Candidatus Saccharibacteria bacterium]
MELIKFASRRSRLSDVVYILLNIAYAAALFILVSPGVDLPYLAFTLVLLSKWRVIAVRPRFWFANVQANFVDFMVGISVVTLMILTASATPWVSALLAALFAGWLLILKPHTAQKWVIIQAAVGQAVALTALFSLAHGFELKPFLTDSSFPTVVLAWIIGYMSARHALTSYKDEDERALLSLVWGFVVAELAWLAHHWTIAYSIYNDVALGGAQQLMIPQIAIVVTLLGFVVIRWYEALRDRDNKKAFKDARSATIFACAVMAILLIFFNGSLDITAL